MGILTHLQNKIDVSKYVSSELVMRRYKQVKISLVNIRENFFLTI